MREYHNCLRDILERGVDRECRNGMTRSLFGKQMHYYLEDGFPAITTKKLAFNAVKGELIGFLRGYNHIDQFQKLGVNIWNANADAYGKDGSLGCIYGVQWRQWQGDQEGEVIDQLANVIENIKNDPYSRRHIVSSWNPAKLEDMALPPCHVLFQFNVAEGKLSLGMYQRSADMFLGVPFNIASYSLLLCMVAQVTNLTPHVFIHTLGDVHIYHQHFDQVREQLSRKMYALPRLELTPGIKSIDDFTIHDIELADYHHHPRIKAEMIV